MDKYAYSTKAHCTFLCWLVFFFLFFFLFFFFFFFFFLPNNIIYSFNYMQVNFMGVFLRSKAGMVSPLSDGEGLPGTDCGHRCCKILANSM